MNKTKIEWCDSTWNPITGCLHGCEYCYARRIAERFGKNYADLSYSAVKHGLHVLDTKFDDTPYPFGFKPTFHAYRLNDCATKKGRNIFVCSMADLFGEWVPDSWIEEVFAACEKSPQHRYLFLTKNPQRYGELAQAGKLPQRENMWYGYSATTENHKEWWNPNWNIFASVEPLLESIHTPRCKWVIIGAETGNRKGKVTPKKEWVDKICEAADITHVAVFMKDSLIPVVGEKHMRREFPWEKAKGLGGS